MRTPRSFKVTAAAAASALLLTACGTAADEQEPAAATGGDGAVGVDGASGGGSDDPCPAVLRFSDTGVEGLETLVIEFEDFRAALEEITGKEVVFFPISSRTAAATALEFNEIDLLLTGPSEYVVLKAVADAIPVVGVTRPGYRAMIIATAESGITSLEQLEGATVITKEVGSTSGHLGPLEMLINAGLEPGVNVEVIPLGSTRIEAFAGGDGAALGTGLKDFEEIEEELGGPGSIVMVEEGPDLPNDLFVAGADLGQDCADWLQDQLVANGQVLLDAITGTGENDKYLESAFVAADDADYNPTRAAFEAAGFSDYASLPED